MYSYNYVYMQSFVSLCAEMETAYQTVHSVMETMTAVTTKTRQDVVSSTIPHTDICPNVAINYASNN